MLSVEQALDIILSHLPEGRTEEVSLRAASGCVLAQDVTATTDIPPFNRAAMDGYALRSADVQTAPAELRVVGEVRAGEGEAQSVGAGEAVAIMTGAPVPEGADAVQMVEVTRRSDDGRHVIIEKPAAAGANIAPKGSEAGLGDVVLEAGRFIGPAEVAVLATFGCTCVRVWRKPDVALLATGDELVEWDRDPRPGQIRNSNIGSLLGQLLHLGIEAEYLGIARDDPEDLRRKIEQGLRHDVLILTGGVSMGEYDFVREVLDGLGLEVLFTKVAMKPGKPTVFARKGHSVVFGLPGNPVSTFVAFEVFVRPALGRLCGLRRPELPRVRGVLSRDLRQHAGRTSFLPALAARGDSGWTIEPVPWKGSGDIIGFSRANALYVFPAERSSLERGEVVEALLLPDYWSRRS